MRVLAIAGNTFREHIRDKILYNLIVFALIMIASSFVLGQLSLGHEDKVMIDLGLSAISVIGTLISIFLGTSLVYKELDRRTIYSLLAKPIRRSEFIIGKYLGLLLTVIVNLAIMSASLAAILAVRGDAPWAAYWILLPASYLIFLSLALTTAMALVFSTFSTPALSALFSLFLWILGHYNSDLLELAQVTKSVTVRGFAKLLYYVLPNISNFMWVDSRSLIQSAGYYRPVDPIAVAWITVYALLYGAVLLVVANAIFSRREFK